MKNAKNTHFININHNWKYNSMNIELINQHKFYLQILQYVEYNILELPVSPF